MYPNNSSMLQKGFGGIVTGRRVLLQLNDRTGGMDVVIDWKGWEKHQKIQTYIMQINKTDVYEYILRCCLTHVWFCSVPRLGVCMAVVAGGRTGGWRARWSRWGPNLLQEHTFANSFRLAQSSPILHSLYYCNVHHCNTCSSYNQQPQATSNLTATRKHNQFSRKYNWYKWFSYRWYSCIF